MPLVVEQVGGSVVRFPAVSKTTNPKLPPNAALLGVNGLNVNATTSTALPPLYEWA